VNAIDLRDITFTYVGGARPALRELTLLVPDNQIVGVVGRAGAGKSTLCALTAGFVPNFYDGRLAGTAIVDGQDVIAQPVAELVRHVGLLGSNAFSQISGAAFTVFEEVAFGLENLGVPRPEIVERVEWALAAMRLTDLRDRSPYALSGGQQQRMVLAAILALRPPVLVLDEPTAGLDPPSTEQLADLLRDLARQGTTILFAEHRLEWAAAVAARIVALDAGQIIADGPAAQVLTDPLLLERGIGWPLPARMAARAREEGRWPAERPLPVTAEELMAGLRGVEGGSQAAGGGSQSAAVNRRSLATGEPDRETRRQGAGAPEGGRPNADGNPPAASRQPPASGLRPPSPRLVELRELRFTYPSGVEALKGASLAVGRGERMALLGRNGAGKSTLVRHLNGLLRPTSGVALVDGTDTRKLTVARCARRVGIVFQDVRNQLFARTVRDELRFGPRNLGYPPARIEALVDGALDALGLREVAGEHPYDLPTATRRLVAVAAVLAMDTDLLVLDEPTSGLDATAIGRLAALAGELAARGKSVIVVSHDLDFCYEALERVVLMRDGRIALDSGWDALDMAARADLRAEVGLPIALQVAEEMAVPAGR
jgi:energy-coupling factor transport system ATP-binding protein